MAPSPAHHHLTWGLPPVRVGWLLARARREAGLRVGDVATTLGVSHRTVRRWEAGAALPTDAQVRAMAQHYRRPVASLLPERDPVHLDDHGAGLRVGGAVVGVDLSLGGNEEILRRYVAVVREQRGLRDESPFVLRHDDVSALAAILDLDDEHLERDLVAIVGCSGRRAAALRQHLLRRRMATPVVAVAMGLGGVAAAAAVSAPLPPPATPAVASAAAPAVASAAAPAAAPAAPAVSAPSASASAPVAAPPTVAPTAPSPSRRATPPPPVAPSSPAAGDPPAGDAAPEAPVTGDAVIGDAVTVEAPLPAVAVPTMDPAGPAVDHVGPPPQILLGEPVVLERHPPHS